MTEWSIQEIAKAAGTTSRALRHYAELGLLTPSRVGRNGYRYYDQDSLVRLQRILLLRELGLGLPAIGEILADQRDVTSALRTHLELLELQGARIARQIQSVQTTLGKTERGERLMASEVFDGFDHTQYEQEVTERWGREAYQRSNDWWTRLTDEEKKGFQQTQLDIARDYGRAHSAGVAPESDEAQDITRRHVAWLSGPIAKVTRGYVIGLGEMYVADPRFTANYDVHGTGTAEFVRDTMKIYAEREFGD